jgi:hypothetical protein
MRMFNFQDRTPYLSRLYTSVNTILLHIYRSKGVVHFFLVTVEICVFSTVRSGFIIFVAVQKKIRTDGKKAGREKALCYAASRTFGLSCPRARWWI